MGWLKSVKKALGGGDKAKKAAEQAAAAERARIAALPIQIEQTADAGDSAELQRRMMEMYAKRGRTASSLIGQGGDVAYQRDRLG